MTSLFLTDFTSAALTGDVVVVALDFLLKSGLLVVLACYLQLSASPFIRSTQTRVLWILTIVMLALLPLSSALLGRLLDSSQLAPMLSLLTVVVPSALDSGPVNAESGSFHILLWAVFICYALGVAFHGIRLSRSIVKMRHIRREADYAVPHAAAMLLERLRRRSGIRRRILLGLSDMAASPVTMGTFTPIIILPSRGYYGDQALLENVLTHELGHIRRYDHVSFIACYILAASCWANPFIWFALRRLSLEAEFACDDDVLSQGDRNLEFASQLVGIARSSLETAPDPTLTLAGSSLHGRGQLSRRVNHILHENYRSASGRCHATRLPVAALILAFVVISGGRLLVAGDADSYLSEDLRLVYAELPEYPEAAWRSRSTGAMQFSFRVDATGKIDPTSIHVIHSSANQILYDASLAALDSFQYSPRKLKGRSVPTSGVSYTFEYDIRI